MLSGKFHGQLESDRRIVPHSAAYALGQLSMTGDRWEKQHHQKLAREGNQDYQLTLAYRGEVDFKVLHATPDIVSVGSWHTLLKRNEEAQLDDLLASMHACAAVF